MAGRYAVQISCTLNGVKQKFLLDTVDDTTINSTSNLSSHPIAQGDIISDHMYRAQSTISLTGSYSLNSGTNLNLGTGVTRLAVFESIFETIKNQGVICELLKISKDNSSNSRFLRRTNLVLTSIEWTEKINSLDFDFTFTQIITSEAATNAQNYSGDITQNTGTFDTTDIYLPTAIESGITTFYGAILTFNAVCSKLNNELININTRTKNLASKIKALGTSGLKSIGISSNAASLISKCFSSYDLNDCDKLFSQGFINSLSSDKIISLFSDDDKIENADIISFVNYLYNIYTKINLLSDNVSCYQCSSAGEQTYTLLIDNVYYEFSFTRNNTTNEFYLSVRNSNSDNKEYSISSTKCSAAPTNFSDLNASNRLFKTTNYNVYLLKLKGSSDSSLSNHYILLSKINPESFCNELDSLIYGE